MKYFPNEILSVFLCTFNICTVLVCFHKSKCIKYPVHNFPHREINILTIPIYLFEHMLLLNTILLPPKKKNDCVVQDNYLAQ